MKLHWQIILGAVLLSCLLGVAVDLVTAHVAVDYFAVHHPRVFASKSPLLLALYWGVASSWWFGLIAGSLVAWVNSRQSTPLEPKRILWMIARACIVIWVLMMLILVSIYLYAGHIPISKRRPTFEYDRSLMAVAIAHMFEYVFGGVATIVLMLRTRFIAKRFGLMNSEHPSSDQDNSAHGQSPN